MRREDRRDGSQGKAEFMNLARKERSKTVSERRSEEEEGREDADFRWSSLLTVCRRRRGLSDEDETRSE